MGNVLMNKGVLVTCDSINTWEGTQEEYDALGDYDEDIMYFITDDTGSCVMWRGTRAMYDSLKEYDPNTLYIITDEQFVVQKDYSLEEQDTGRKWIDGKPIYEIVIDLGGNVAISNSQETAFPDDIQIIIKALNPKQFIYCILFINDDNYTGASCPCEITIKNNDIYHKSIEPWSIKANRNIKMLIQYTKTTD